MTKDPYAAGKINPDVYALKKDVQGDLVVVLDSTMENRGLELMKPPSRCLLENEVHELILTTEETAKPGAQVNSIAYLGFFVVEKSGVIVAGDELYVNGECIGHLAGFDDTHMPNHLNIVIRAYELVSGANRGLTLGTSIRFHKK